MEKADLVRVLSEYEDDFFLKGSLKKAVETLEPQGSGFHLRLRTDFPLFGEAKPLAQRLSQFLSEHFQVPVLCELSMQIKTHTIQSGLKAHPEIKNVIVVASGKGGVGKSTTAVNLALALGQAGACVGLLDADIYGPSIPMMLGAYEQPEIVDKQFIPIERFGLSVMSIAYLVPEDAAMVWRGPMVSGALMQLFQDTRWSNLDYLIVDLPPGTGDIQLTLSQKIPVSGAVIVSTPQEIALLDAKKAIKMFEKVNVPILGLVENMSAHLCTHCGHDLASFGTGGVRTLAMALDLPCLLEMPLLPTLCQSMDEGKPLFLPQYREMAKKVAMHLAKRPRYIPLSVE